MNGLDKPGMRPIAHIMAREPQSKSVRCLRLRQQRPSGRSMYMGLVELRTIRARGLSTMSSHLSYLSEGRADRRRDKYVGCKYSRKSGLVACPHQDRALLSRNQRTPSLKYAVLCTERVKWYRIYM